MKAEVNVGKRIVNEQLQQIKRDNGAEKKEGQRKFFAEGAKQKPARLFPNGFFHLINHSSQDNVPFCIIHFTIN